MSSNRVAKPVIFLLGAGFNADAASEAGCQGTLLPDRYPLVSDLLKICFKRDALPFNKSIEELFQESIDRGETQPLETLYDIIMKADLYIAPRLKRGESHDNNIYTRFLRDFPKSPLITFNYDSLPEILLLAENSWSPKDGYGVPVQAHQRTIRKGPLPIEESLRPVLHLHGSLCIDTSTYYFAKQPEHNYPIMQDYNEPKFLFDPERLGNCFSPFERILPSLNYTEPFKRVIAPIPDKAEGLNGEFVTAVYNKAVELLNTASQIVAIGYSFNRNDRASYAQLLDRVADKPVLLVAPDAGTLIKRLAQEHSNIPWEAKSMTFKEWVNNGYPGVRK